jgi:transposase-like protein
MVTQKLKCNHCGSEQIKKNGFSPNGKQKYKCKACGRASRENPKAKGYSEARKEEILKAYQERSSLRGLRRTFGVSRTTVTKWLKKSRDLASLE